MPVQYIAAVFALSVVGVQPPATVTAEIAKRFSAQIMVEPRVTLPTSSPAAAKATTIEKALDAAVADVPQVTWRRLYVQLAPGKPWPSATSLADRVRTLERQAGTNVVVEKPSNNRGTVLMTNQTITQTYRKDLTRAQYRTVYLLYSTVPPQKAATPADTPSARESAVVVDVFGDMLGAFFSLDQSAQREGMQQAMSLLAGLDSPSRAEFVTMMWRSMGPDLQQDVVRSVMRAERANPGRR